MTVHYFDTQSTLHDPLEIIEFVAAQSHIKVERIDDAELHLNIGGLWRDVALWFAWREDMRMLQMGAPLELKVPSEKIDDIYKLLVLVNERVWMGHFDLWSDDQGIVYRNANVLSGSSELEATQAEILIRGAAEAFEKFYPAFNYVIWGNKSPEEALEFSMFEVAGNA